MNLHPRSHDGEGKEQKKFRQVHKMKETIVFRVPDGDKARIERYIKQQYPKTKTISEVVRAALTDFLAKQEQ